MLVISILLTALTASAANGKFTLVIDAGHGGNDAGAVGSFSKEKDINLKTALAFGGYVERNCPDVKVIYTRKTDVFVTLHGRAEIANKAKADLFISIHTNALPGGRIARGFETYTLGMHRAADNLDVAKRENAVILVEKDYKQHYEGFDPNSAESYIIFEFMQDNNMAKSVELAKYVQKNVCSLGSRPDKGVKQAGFLVLRETSMPSCLIELGFISTPDEEQLLNSEAGIANNARGIYNAFIAYKQRFDNSTDVPYRPEEAVEIPQIVPENKKESTRGKGQADPLPQKAVQEKPVKTEKTPEGPVFKIQICTAERVLKTTDARLKGHKDAEYYKENGLVKYTIGSTTDYNEILQLRKDIQKEFPDAFVIAFKNGDKVNTADAINEYKKNKK